MKLGDAVRVEREEVSRQRQAQLAAHHARGHQRALERLEREKHCRSIQTSRVQRNQEVLPRPAHVHARGHAHLTMRMYMCVCIHTGVYVYVHMCVCTSYPATAHRIARHRAWHACSIASATLGSRVHSSHGVCVPRRHDGNCSASGSRRRMKRWPDSTGTTNPDRGPDEPRGCLIPVDEP